MVRPGPLLCAAVACALTWGHTLYVTGFPIKVTERQLAERKACDVTSELEQHVWMEYIENDKLPARESKTKDMIRKVRTGRQ